MKGTFHKKCCVFPFMIWMFDFIAIILLSFVYCGQLDLLHVHENSVGVSATTNPKPKGYNHPIACSGKLNPSKRQSHLGAMVLYNSEKNIFPVQRNLQICHLVQLAFSQISWGHTHISPQVLCQISCQSKTLTKKIKIKIKDSTPPL